jgi:hypothetical protein
MVNRESADLISLTLESRPWCDLDELDREMLLLASQGDRAPQKLFASRRSMQPHGICASLERKRPAQSNDSKNMVSVQMREKNIDKCEAHSVPHHLPLGSFAAVEEQGLAFANNRDRGDIALNSGARR